MTWDELAKRILEMTDSERAQTVQYFEPWDDAAEIFAVDVMVAQENLSDPEGVIQIQKGENFLQ